MAHIKLGTTTMKNVMEFLVYDEYNKQCATIYYAINKRDNKRVLHYDAEVKCEIIGEIPVRLIDEVEKLNKIADTALKYY